MRLQHRRPIVMGAGDTKRHARADVLVGPMVGSVFRDKVDRSIERTITRAGPPDHMTVVEMSMRIDKARQTQAPCKIDLRPTLSRRGPRPNECNLATGDAYFGKRQASAPSQYCIFQHEALMRRYA